MPFGFLQAFGRPRLVPTQEGRPHVSVYQLERKRFLLLLDRTLSDYGIGSRKDLYPDRNE